MRFANLVLLGVMAASITACGKREDLKPQAGDALPVTPVGMKVAPTPEDLTTPSAQARPERKDELLKRSEERPADEFDLPPPG